MALQIRDVTDDVRQALVERARGRGQSLQAFLLSLVEDEARRSANLALLDRFADRKDGSKLSSSDATDGLDIARTARDAQFAEGPATGDVA